MTAAEKEWLRAEQEWLQQEDERLLRLYGADYVEWLAAETHLEHVARDVRDKYDLMELEVASARLREGGGKGTDLARGDERGWVSVRCTTGACKRGSCNCPRI